MKKQHYPAVVLVSMGVLGVGAGIMFSGKSNSAQPVTAAPVAPAVTASPAHTQWEYNVIHWNNLTNGDAAYGYYSVPAGKETQKDFHGFPNLQTALATAGADGWEYVGEDVGDGWKSYVLKRPK